LARHLPRTEMRNRYLRGRVVGMMDPMPRIAPAPASARRHVRIPVRDAEDDMEQTSGQTSGQVSEPSPALVPIHTAASPYPSVVTGNAALDGMARPISE
jgi:hypothetical protein